MKLFRLLLALPVLGLVVGVAYVAQATESAEAKMADAADKFLASLNGDQKTKAALDFDDKERFNWHFTPYQDSRQEAQAPRPAPRGDEQGAEGGGPGPAPGRHQRQRLRQGHHHHEPGDDPRRPGEGQAARLRNPGKYFFTVFGTPSKTGTWGWRVEGHHLSLNFTLDKGKVVVGHAGLLRGQPRRLHRRPQEGASSAPRGRGLRQGPVQGARRRPEEGGLAEGAVPRDRGGGEDADQGRRAEGAGRRQDDRQAARPACRSCSRRMPTACRPTSPRSRWAASRKPGSTRSTSPTRADWRRASKHTYRVQGPTFVIEFLNVQADSANNPANHIHSAWRSLKNDFGLATP